MKSNPLLRAALLLSVLALPGLAVQRPAPAPAPAVQPAQDPAKREARAQQAEANRKAQEEREAAERDRVKSAREKAKAGENAPQSASTQNNETREAARNLFALERVHRERLARIERLMSLFREKGDQAKLLELEKLRAKENKRYGRFLEKYKQEMGPAYEQVEKSLNAGAQRKAPGQGSKDNGKQPAPPRAREPKSTEKEAGGQ